MVDQGSHYSYRLHDCSSLFELQRQVQKQSAAPLEEEKEVEVEHLQELTKPAMILLSSFKKKKHLSHWFFPIEHNVDFTH